MCLAMIERAWSAHVLRNIQVLVHFMTLSCENQGCGTQEPVGHVSSTMAPYHPLYVKCSLQPSHVPARESRTRPVPENGAAETSHSPDHLNRAPPKHEPALDRAHRTLRRRVVGPGRWGRSLRPGPASARSQLPSPLSSNGTMCCWRARGSRQSTPSRNWNSAWAAAAAAAAARHAARRAGLRDRAGPRRVRGATAGPCGGASPANRW